jgi:hypothetical protein
LRNPDSLLNHLIVFLGLAVVAAMVVMFAVAMRTSHLGRDAAAYVESNVPAIVAGWNPAELERRVVPEMLSSRIREGIRGLFSELSSLGHLKSLAEPAGRIGSGAFPGTTINGTWADYGVEAQFDGGKARIQLILKRVDDGWQIAGFSVRRSNPATSHQPSPPEGGEGDKKRRNP